MRILPRRSGAHLLLVPILFLAAGTCLAWRGGAPKKPKGLAQGDYSYVARSMEYRIPREIKKHHLPSMAIALVDDQEVVWAKGLGLANIEEGAQATTQTVYRQWSISKLLTAFEVMRLVEEGLVDLDAPITDYIPQFSVASRFPNDGPITIRSLLAHRSGLPRNGNLQDSHLEVAGLDILRDQVMSLADSQVAYPVGTRFKYSNVGYDLLGLLVEEVRGQKYSPYMRARFLLPIGMRHSAFLTTQVPEDAEVAMGYEYYKGKHHPIRRGDCTSFPSGNLHAPLDDMVEFVRFIFRGGEAGGTHIMKPTTIAAMFEEQYTNPMEPRTNGLGWFTNNERFGEELVWHHGGDSGTNALIALLPGRKLGVVLAANEQNYSAGHELPLAADALGLMLEAKFGETPATEQRSETVKIDESTLSAYVGKYVVFGEVMDVSLRDGKLKAKVQGMTLGLKPIGENRFMLTHWLMKFGLGGLFPVDLRQFELEFLTDSGTDEVVLVVHAANVHSELCPQCPEVKDVSAAWGKLAGRYEIVYRGPSGGAEEESLGHVDIRIEDSLIRSPMGLLNPISATEFSIIGGPFEGETVTYDPETECLRRQGLTYRPAPGG